MIKLGKSFDEARTVKLIGGKRTPFGIYLDTVADAMPLGLTQINTSSGTFTIRVSTGIATSIGKVRRLYQVAFLM